MEQNSIKTTIENKPLVGTMSFLDTRLVLVKIKMITLSARMRVLGIFG